MGDDGFAVTLNFGNQPEPLYIPYDAIKTFVDPSVEFGLRFESPGDEEIDEDDLPPEPINTDHAREKPEESEKSDAEIVSLDSFRKH